MHHFSNNSPDSFHPSDYIDDPEPTQICDECGSSGTCFKTCSFVNNKTNCNTCGQETTGGELCWDCLEIEMGFEHPEELDEYPDDREINEFYTGD